MKDWKQAPQNASPAVTLLVLLFPRCFVAVFESLLQQMEAQNRDLEAAPGGSGCGEAGDWAERLFPKLWSSVGTGVGQGLWRELGVVSGPAMRSAHHVPAESSGSCSTPLNLICGAE